MCFGRRRGEVIGDKPGNTDSDPDSSEKAVPQGEGRTGLPLLPALRQDLPGGHPRPRLPVGESQWRCTGSGWPDIPGNRVEWVGEMAGWHQGRTTRKDVPAATGATGDDPEAWGRGKTARDTDGHRKLHPTSNRIWDGRRSAILSIRSAVSASK